MQIAANSLDKLWSDRHKAHRHPPWPHLSLNAVVEILKRAQQEELPVSSSADMP
jgi:hypothetical protein